MLYLVLNFQAVGLRKKSKRIPKKSSFQTSINSSKITTYFKNYIKT